MSKEQQIECLKSFEEKSLPEYALKRLYDQELSEEEATKCEWFCKALLAQN